MTKTIRAYTDETWIMDVPEFISEYNHIIRIYSQRIEFEDEDGNVVHTVSKDDDSVWLKDCDDNFAEVA